MVSRVEIKAGEKLTADMVVYRNPGIGILPKDAFKIIGKVAKANIKIDNLLSFDMFE
jgi:sialic acid synthase SpsE